ncbi:LacI family DNA-binding transcriptional regulator [Niallia sp. 01092]|uniref:LacI family DNA-binding transcriptional regulator n=1 Tax=unclassified Niallia TaxID=2837522 RepID=UPI003FD60DC4
MAITIKDVGKEANVSPSTVSRVLANHPKISEETKRKVREAMEKLGYHPNLQARSLVVKSANAIGIVMPHSAESMLENPFFPEVIRGISLKARENKYGIYLTTGAEEEEIYQEVVQMVQGKRVDGIILLYSKKNDKVMDYLVKVKFPFAVIGRPYSNAEQITYVDNDNISITKQITEYLINMGHQHIAFVGANMEMVFTIDRLEGYRQALEQANIPFDESIIIYDKEMKVNAKKQFQQLLQKDVPPTALVVADDFVAIELISYAEEWNISVPEDISIVGFNNIIVAKHIKPSLTSIDINIYQLGIEAADCLIDNMKNSDSLPKKMIIPAKMVERKSCSPIPNIL